MTYILPSPVDDEKENNLQSSKQLAFKARIAAERKAEAEELEQQLAEEALMRAMKSKPVVEKQKRKYKKRIKKVEPCKAISVKVVPVEVVKLILPVYYQKIEVNEFNQHKVDYIKRQIFFCKDPKRKMIYENALTKYNL